MRVIVTGGAGFIGSHTVEGLVADGHEILVLDDLSTGSRANLTAVQERIAFRRLDVRDRAGLCEAFAAFRPEGAVHLAALASVPASIARPELAHDVNLTGTFNVFEAARRSGVRRLVFGSSAAVYGIEPPLPSGESDPLLPASPYAAQKAAGELLARAYRAAFGLETASLRFFNVYGERQRADSSYSGVISVFVEAMRRQGWATIAGDGEQTRDFIHVDDVTRAIAAALSGPDPGADPINVARGTALSVRQLYSVLADLLGVPDAPRFGPPRPGDVRHSLARIDRLRAVLGVEPRVEMRDGLARLLRRLAD